ncbi:MAG: hypothetical protein A3K77_00810 [Euryarchaeota archaeon RBG_13_31_8]|nr:MAG: hypothetical protein A3K77_00810 [Euryarchaeota archaeon RBG_13_31_8]
MKKILVLFWVAFCVGIFLGYQIRAKKEERNQKKIILEIVDMKAEKITQIQGSYQNKIILFNNNKWEIMVK